MNWGKSIFWVFVLFALLMFSFLIRALLSGGESVPDQYYEKGNKYQEVLDAEKDAEKFGPDVEYDPSIKFILFKFKSRQVDSVAAYLQWPPNAKKNIRYHSGTLGKDQMFGVFCEGPVGSWNAELEFWSAGKKYIYHQKVWVE